MLYEATGAPEYLDEAKATMAGLIPTDKSPLGWSRLFRATPPQEKNYLFSLMNVKDPEERQKILNRVPPEVAEILNIQWKDTDLRMENIENSDIYSKLPASPRREWIGWHPACLS